MTFSFAWVVSHVASFSHVPRIECYVERIVENVEFVDSLLAEDCRVGCCFGCSFAVRSILRLVPTVLYRVAEQAKKLVLLFHTM